MRIRPWHLALLLILASSAVTATLYYFRIKSEASVEVLAARLPARDDTVLFLDVRAIREAGLLALLARLDGKQETEYLEFVERTGFDYSRDLTSALIAFDRRATFALLTGRFDWGRLMDYVGQSGGTCYNGFCQARAASPRRWISFFSVTPWVMAIATSEDPWAASELLEKRPQRQFSEIPAEPVWLRMSGAALAQAGWLPSGARAFVSPILAAEQLTLLLGPAPSGIEARIDVTCRSAEDAQKVAQQLQEVTEALRRLIRLEGKAPNPKDLSGVFTGGTFRSEGLTVAGRWPIPAELIQALAAGAI